MYISLYGRPKMDRNHLIATVSLIAFCLTTTTAFDPNDTGESCFLMQTQFTDSDDVRVAFTLSSGHSYVIEASSGTFIAEGLLAQVWSTSGYLREDNVDHFNYCYIKGNVSRNGEHIGEALLNRCQNMIGSIITEEEDSGLYRIDAKVTARQTTHCISYQSEPPPSGRMKRSIVSTRLSARRKLNAVTAVFIDKEYADKFYKNISSSREDLTKHALDILHKLGYSDFHGYCRFQSTFLPGGTRSDGTGRDWGISIYFSGVYGLFGKVRSTGKVIWGRAFQAGACDPVRMCSGGNDHLGYDNYMSRLLAHETGHLFNMPDDYNEPYKNICPAGLMFSQFDGMFWSKCSIKGMKEFLRSEKSTCLDTRVPKKPKKSSNLIRLSWPIRKVIRCPADGGWSKWSDFGPCSRMCGAGVKISNRSCTNPPPGPGGRICIGASFRVKYCYEQACPTIPKTRHELLSSECGILGQAKIYAAYDPAMYGTGSTRCTMLCTASAIKLSFKPHKARNGKSCSDRQNDVCVDGVCTELGCDNSFESKKRFDKCGICGGDGSTCQSVSFVYNQQKIGNFMKIRLIPTGSKFITIRLDVDQLSSAKGNIIHVGTGDFDSVPTIYLIPNDKGIYKFKFAGTVWEYIKTNQLPHLLRAKGPTNIDSYIMIKKEKDSMKNPGVSVQFVQPKVP
ncbi:A disintegrin and metalloproteinase with thrombospondin motifs 6-like isoform X2 [Tubulanus polymorphus]|uniref:A disintegrin and metalloproteinase with thrombospondin motifs 6-like isoform X2 n=1 Tax=Tubulanus polymorphus TaxID=672921 RepID=UPI003DA28D4F